MLSCIPEVMLEYKRRIDRADAGYLLFEGRAHLAKARVLRATDAAAGGEAIGECLDRAAALLEESGARGYLPFVHEERAHLQRASGDEAAASESLAAARAVFEANGAPGHLRRLRG